MQDSRLSKKHLVNTKWGSNHPKVGDREFQRLLNLQMYSNANIVTSVWFEPVIKMLRLRQHL